MLDKIKGLKKYTDCSMPTNNNELRQKESVSGYNQAIEDVVKIFSIYAVSQQRKLLLDFWMKLPKTHKHKGVAEHYIDNYLKSNNCG
jgi:hypothetical protein